MREEMPVYDYECAACGRTCEVLVRSGDPKPRCPSCKSTRLKKSFSAPSIISKGGSSGAPKKTSSRSSCARSSCSGCSGCH